MLQYVAMIECNENDTLPPGSSSPEAIKSTSLIMRKNIRQIPTDEYCAIPGGYSSKMSRLSKASKVQETVLMKWSLQRQDN